MIKKVIYSIFINIISHEREKLRYRFVRIMQDPYRCEEKKRESCKIHTDVRKKKEIST